MRSLYRRRFCLKCSPFGAHNTSRFAPGSSDEERKRSARARRLRSWVAYGRERRRKRKRELVAAFGGACIECGYARTVATLEFHHREAGTKEFSIAEFSGSRERLLAEAAKCDLLCANCHRRRHAMIAEHSDPAAAARRRLLKARAVDALGGRCEGCGTEHVSSIFEFHHRDGKTKDFGISEDGILRRWEDTARELEKCMLLCANCHREVHAGVLDLDEGVASLTDDERYVA